MIVIAGILFKSFTRIGSKSSIFLNVLVLLFSLLFFSIFFSMASYASDEVRRILSLVDYIGGDYKNAVQGGKVISQEEYKEMLEFSSDALRLFLEQKALDGDRAGIETDLITLKSEIEDKSSNNNVELLSKGIKDRIISAYDITPYPENHPSFRAGMDLYERNCAQCHGVLGAGNGSLASGIKPPPTSFTDGNTIGGLSPFKIYNTMSFGIEGTAMPSFKNFSEMDKWDVAFYVLSLRYSQKESEEGKKIFNASGIPDSIKEPKTLATLSDDELSDKLNPYLRNDKDLPGVVAFLRRDNIETKGTEGDPIVLTNTMLKEAIRLYEQGNGKDAYTKVLDAYLDGFERVEPMLISKDKAFVSMVESKFVTFRGLI
ncbi:MAG TPA: cytochrome c, partial [Thermodesulfobacteriota bacterium]